MPRFISVIMYTVVFALLAAMSSPALAQESSPESAESSPVAGESLLAEFGYPALEVTFDGTDFVAPEELEAGRYRLVFNNLATDVDANLELYQPPDGMTGTELADAIAVSGESEEAPEFFYTMVSAGGVEAPAGGSNDAIVTFGPGEWVFNVFTESEDSLTNQPHVVDVTGELPELTDPEADVTVTLAEMSITFDGTVAAGPQVWKVTNVGAFPHFLIVEAYPEPVTPEQVEATLAMFFGTPATPSATPVAPLDPEQFVAQVETPIFSTGQANWIEVDLEPGTYVAFCFIEGPGDVPSHAALGMYSILTVE